MFTSLIPYRVSRRLSLECLGRSQQYLHSASIERHCTEERLGLGHSAKMSLWYKNHVELP